MRLFRSAGERMNQAETKSKMRPGFQNGKAGKGTRPNSFSCLESPAVAAHPLRPAFLIISSSSAFPVRFPDDSCRDTPAPDAPPLPRPGSDGSEAFRRSKKADRSASFIASSSHPVSRSSSSNIHKGTPKMSAMSGSRSSSPPTVCAYQDILSTIRRKVSSGSRTSASATSGATATKAGRCGAPFTSRRSRKSRSSIAFPRQIPPAFA